MFYIIFCEVYRVLNTRIYILKMFIYIYIYIYTYIYPKYTYQKTLIYTHFCLFLKLLKAPGVSLTLITQWTHHEDTIETATTEVTSISPRFDVEIPREKFVEMT